MSNTKGDFVLVFSHQSESVITGLFFAYGEVHQKICALRRTTIEGVAKISSAELDSLSAEVEKMHKSLLALREVFPEAFCLGFVEALRSAGREDLLSSYPDIERIASARRNQNPGAD